ncbi:hypothetical protein [Kordia jejudonensis]|uniref:hypothetical protein n=1 Tax=Kordia jejudonensis TaxID=1348245 RepID=UPI000629C48E|nr:hypothetical protein [Kordia jejudonensis]
MITLKDYIGKIYKEVTNAKVQSDIETLAIAQEYVNNPMLKHFSVPNIRIKDMELTIPVAVDSINTSSAYTEREVQNVYEAAFEKVYLSFYPFKTVRLEEMKSSVTQKAAPIAATAVVELTTVSAATQSPDTPTTATSSEEQLRTAETVKASELTYESVNTNYAKNFAEAIYGLVSSEIEQGEFYAQLIPEIERNLQPKSFALEELPVIVETSRLKQISDPGSMISIKVNITDDAMEWTTDVDENGNTIQVLNYE